MPRFALIFSLVFQFTSFFFYAQESNMRPAYTTYWQQKVEYTMDIDMNVNTYQYVGKQHLVYTNNSPDVLHKVYYHLYFNAFQPESEMNARLQSIVDPDDRMVEVSGDRKNKVYQSKISKLKPEEMGFIKINSFAHNGKSVHYVIEGTVMEVTLDVPIPSGGTAVFDMDFIGQVPNMIRRAGRNSKEGVALSMAQWYPKMAAYDVEGWHTDPYISREFYGVWGDYDVTIHIDKDFVLGGTGYLENAQEVGYGYENKLLPLQLPKGNQLTWHFKAPNVHDFTWAADKEFIHDHFQVQNGPMLHFLYKKDIATQKIWKDIQPYAAQIITFYEAYIGKYPYQQYSIIQGGDGGMEYGMCTLVHGGNNLNGMIGLLAHEMAHAWFQFTLATNESKHPWMDEGFASYVETLALQYLLKKKDFFPFEETYAGYFYMATSGNEEPLTTHADRYATNSSYSLNAYYKGSVFLAQLSYVIGDEALKNTIQEYYEQWGGKNPGPQDFIRIAEKVSGIHLDWYLNEFVETTHVVDYGIKSVQNQEIVLERLGTMPMPIDLEVFYEDGSKEQFYIPLNLMRGEKKTSATILKDWGWGYPTYKIVTDQKIIKVQIDPSHYMADLNTDNNGWGK